MKYTDTTDNLHVQKRVTLNGPNNYNDWLRAINNKLISKDVFGVASGIELPHSKSHKLRQNSAKMD